jgi:hypothetical protein
MLEDKRQICQEHKNGIKGLSSRQLLHLRKNGTFSRIFRKITVRRIVKLVVRSMNWALEKE